MSDHLAKIQKLIALALNNPNVQESQCAALKAVTLIRDHKITLIDPTVNPARDSVPINDRIKSERWWAEQWQQQKSTWEAPFYAKQPPVNEEVRVEYERQRRRYEDIRREYQRQQAK